MESRHGTPPLDWEQIKELAADALELPAGERQAFVDRVCKDDDALRGELLSLIDADETVALQPDAFAQIEVTAVLAELEQTTAPADPGLPEGTVFDGFVLGRMIGEGGMGRVYRATQTKPHRAVAIKVMRAGLVPTDAERRFAWEIEALGRLEHPAIARVYGAGIGTSEGGARVPWFAMELIDGRPLIEACDAHDLGRDARIALFLEVCDGVAHAHRRGVIHRDLKPDNVLVDGDARPHIVDFGIAHTADPVGASVARRTDEIVGTLLYMSPEQVVGDARKVDARTDVYALGVILFRMLTGQPPLVFDTPTITAVALKLTGSDARLAGSADPSLRGSDLEAVLATALAREADRRYPTVDAFAEDLRRMQRHEPVTARSQTTLYQLERFARRNRGLVASIAVAFVLLAAGIVGTAVGLVRARHALGIADQQTRRAETERDRARAVNTFLENMLRSADPAVQGRERTLAEWIALAGEELEADDTLSDPVRASLRMTLGLTNFRLGALDEARHHLERATELSTKLYGMASPEAVEARAAWCEAATDRSDTSAARALLDEVVAAIAGMRDPPAWARIRATELRAGIEAAAGELEAAAGSYAEVLDFWRRQGADGLDAVETARNNLAVTLLELGRPQDAIELLRESAAWREATFRPDHPKVLMVKSNLASALSSLGEAGEAIRLYEQLLPHMERTLGESHPHTLSARNNLASALDVLERHADALPVYQVVLERQRALTAENHPSTVLARNNVAACLMSLGRFEDAADQFTAMYGALASTPPEERDERLLLNVRMNLASALTNAGKHDAAWEHSSGALTGFEQLLGDESMQTLITRNNHVTLAWEVDQLDLALRLAERNLELAEQHYPDHPYIEIAFRPNLARTYRRLGRLDDALRELLRTEADFAARVDANPERLAKYRRWIREILVELGRDDEAATWRARSEGR